MEDDRDQEGVFIPIEDAEAGNQMLKALLADFAIVSREPIIREYDHEVQGNTILKPLAGASGDAPQDGSVIRVDRSTQLVALGLSLLPEWGKSHPHLMGRACVDECIRQLVAIGANPERIAILDNFCVGNPDEPRGAWRARGDHQGHGPGRRDLRRAVRLRKGLVLQLLQDRRRSGLHSRHALVSGFGIVEDEKHVVGASIRGSGNKLCLVGLASSGLAGSVFARMIRSRVRRTSLSFPNGPSFDEAEAFDSYLRYYQLIEKGVVLSAHDVSEGGLAVTLAEAGFSGKAGSGSISPRRPV